ncbi:peptidase domain-containing ABC transporter [Elizabethkingia ursingii]|nr:peptidase domain-containing ABC transporter [Elizabethkingia ursingii]
MDCGPACLAMVSSHYGKNIGLQYLRDISYLSKEGVSLLGIDMAAQQIGFETYAGQLKIEDIEQDLLPCILHWNQNHFVVLYRLKKNLFTGKKSFKIADPGYGYIDINKERFKNSWITTEDTGVALFLKPTEHFFDLKIPKEKDVSLKETLRYLMPFRKKLFSLFILLILGSLTTFALPLLTQKLIDDGVGQKKLNLIIYILLAQLAFFFGNIIFEIFRNWIMLKVGARINITIIKEFLGKLLNLPIKFFDTKVVGDFNQRISDHERIEQFLTSQSLLTIFSILNFLVFFVILWSYEYSILLIYITLTLISIFWSLFWLKKRKIIDYVRFQQRSENQQSIYEIINGVSELKLNNFEEYKKDEWERTQDKLFQTNLRILKLDQTQASGFEFINQIKNIFVTFLAAYFVVNGKMTLGALLSVSYIIGQMNSPINQLIIFFRSLQDAKLSLIRLNEVKFHPEEEIGDLTSLADNASIFESGIHIDNVCYQYDGPQSPLILNNVNLFIPKGKVTAIVGASGSGKTTMMKLLLRFYNPTKGTISYEKQNILSLSPKNIRTNCGVVMQNGYIFSDTIERNIATNDVNIDQERLEHAVNVANIKSFIEELPLGYKTKIGAAGNGISGGQTQRILIARAVYKNPHYIFFDEATSALDAENEKIIHDNLQLFFKGKTVVIIAHRLSTVKNADQIIVLKQGKIVEEGKHSDLVQRKGEYFNLVKNQLELGL